MKAVKWSESIPWLRVEFFARDLLSALWVLMPSPKAALKRWCASRQVSASVLQGTKEYRAGLDRKADR